MTPQSKASSSSVTPKEYGSTRAINIAEKVKVPVLLPVALKECLVPHAVCTQEYHDFTGAFRLRCGCSCHNEQNGSGRQCGERNLDKFSTEEVTKDV